MRVREGYKTFNQDQFDGYSDKDTEIYDEKKAKKKHRFDLFFLMFLMCLMIGLLVYTFVLHQNDLKYEREGTKQAAAWLPNSDAVSFVAPNNKVYHASTHRLFIKRGTDISVYYIGNDYAHALVLMNKAVWPICYVVFTAVFIAALVKFIKSKFPKKHAV